MGIIVRQALKQTAVTWVGQVIGFLSVLFVYPLEWETYGLAQFAIAVSALLLPFASLGSTSLIVRFFPDFQNGQNGHQGFLGLLLLGAVFSFALFSILAYTLESGLLGMLDRIGLDAQKFSENRLFIFSMVAVLFVQTVLVQHCSNFKRVVAPIVFTRFLHKFLFPALILLLYFRQIDLSHFKMGFVIMYGLSILLLIGYLIHLGQLSLRINWSFLSTPLLKKMSTYAFFGFFTSMGTLLAFRIDTVMVTSFLGYELNGFYSSFLFMTNVILVPYSALAAIANPIISQAWSSTDLTEIRRIYRGSSETLLAVGLLLFLGTWICLFDLLQLTTDLSKATSYRAAFFYLGLGQVVNMAAGVNDPIISYSRYYKFNLVALLFLGLLAIMTNYLLIPKFGLVGAGMATAISLVLFNLLKLVFIRWKFGLQPFGLAQLKLVAIGLFAFVIASSIPSFSHHLISLIIKGACFVLLFVGPLLLFKISPEIQNLVTSTLERWQNR